MVPAAHGSDGGGSIRIPASECGLVGLKVTRGRISSREAGDLDVGFAVHGVLTRTVRDTGRMRLVRGAALVPFTPPFNVSGQPAISLPMHWNDDGLPIGVQLVAAYGREDILIAVAGRPRGCPPVGLEAPSHLGLTVRRARARASRQKENACLHSPSGT